VTLASVSPADAPKGENSSEQRTSAAAPRTYRVVGDHALLSQHVGEQVEVTGTLEEQKASPASTANGARAVRSEPAHRASRIRKDPRAGVRTWRVKRQPRPAALFLVRTGSRGLTGLT
jgi:hypothetical protein